MILFWSVLITAAIINGEMILLVFFAPWLAGKAMKRAMKTAPKKLSTPVMEAAMKRAMKTAPIVPMSTDFPGTPAGHGDTVTFIP